MVSVVTGAGAGLVHTSKELVGPEGELGQSTLGRAGERVTVNAATGNLVVQNRDEFLVGLGEDVGLLRTYNSQGVWDGDNNDNWRIGYYRRVSNLTGTVNTAGSTVKRLDADGLESTYSYSSTSGLYVGTAGAGSYDTLSFDAASSQWTWTDGDTGTRETYGASSAGSSTYRLTKVTDAQANTVTVSYDSASGLIDSIRTSTTGSATVKQEVATLVYDSARRLTQIDTQYGTKDPDASDYVTATRTRVRYEYDTNGRLEYVRTDLTPDKTDDASTYSVQYGYDAAGRINSIVQTDGSTLFIAYDSAGRARSWGNAADGFTTLRYAAAAISYTDDKGSTTALTCVDVTDPMGRETTLGYDSAKRLVLIRGAAAGGDQLTQRFEYDSSGNLSAAIHTQTVYDGTNLKVPAGARSERISYAYNGSGAMTSRTDAAGNLLKRSYNGANQLVSETLYSVADPDGPAGPGAASGAMTTRYYYDTATNRRLLFVRSDDGRVTRYQYNALGQRTGATVYTNQRYTVSTTPTLDELTAWANGMSADDLALAQQTDYGYDLRGQLSSIKEYGTATINAGVLVRTAKTEQVLVYDAFGQLLTKSVTDVDNTTAGTVYVYDGLGRITKSTDQAGASTSYSYGDATNQTTVTLANGQYTVSQYTAAGQLQWSSAYSAAKVALGTTNYYYDADGELRMVQDPTGRRSWMVYDDAGHKTADIDAAGQVTEYVYDGADRLVQTIDYATAKTPSWMAALVDANAQPTYTALMFDAADVRPPVDFNDRITTRYYDPAGRLVGVQDAEGFLTETLYDGASRVIGTTAYATANTYNPQLYTRNGSAVATPPSLDAVRPPADADNDRVTRNFYSDDGLLLGTLDAEGYLTEWVYDAAGRKVQQTRYSRATDAGLRASGTLSGLRPGAQAQDQRQLWLYDTQGRVAGELDAEGHLTEYGYDAADRITSIKRWGALSRQTVSVDATSAVRYLSYSGLSLAALRPASSDCQLTTRTYTKTGLLDTEMVTTADANGSASVSTQYVYDSLGRLTSTERAAGSGDSRTSRVSYDAWGRVQMETDARGNTRSYAYDSAGRRISATDERKNTTVFYYDNAGRLVYSILKDLDPTRGGGEVRETSYNVFGEVVGQTTHAKRLSLADSKGLSGGMLDSALAAKVAALLDTAKDSRTQASFNRRGLIQQAIDALGNVTDNDYTAFGQLWRSTADLGDASARRLSTTLSYDRRGLLTASLSDPNGLAVGTATEYDAFGRVKSQTDARGQTSRYRYVRNGADNGGRAVVLVDANLGEHTTVYDAFERVVTQIDALGHSVSFVFDAAARGVTMTTAEGVQVNTAYTVHGQVWRVTKGAETTTYGYNAKGQLLSVTDALGSVTLNDYDAAGNLLSTASGLALVAGSTVNDGSATTTLYTFDAANRVLSRRVDPNGLNLTTSYSYDGQGRNVKLTDALNIVTSYAFNAAGQLTDVIVDNVSTGLKLKSSTAYDAQGRVLSVTQGAGTTAARTTQYVYDVLGRCTDEIVDPDGLKLTTSYEYDAAGNTVLQRDALRNATRYVYDALGRLQYTIDAVGGVSERRYDAQGRLVAERTLLDFVLGSAATLTEAQIRDALAAQSGARAALVQYVYDDDGRQIYAVDAEGGVTQTDYDGAGRVVLTTRYATAQKGAWDATRVPVADAAKDEKRWNVYDAAGRVRFSIDALGAVTENVYDRAGRVTASKQYANTITLPGVLSEDSVVSALATRLDAKNDSVTYCVYDAAGRRRYTIDALGYVTESVYDRGGHVTAEKHYAKTITVPATRIEANIASALATRLDSKNDRSEYRVYDAAGRQRYTFDALGYVTERLYDAASRVTATKRYASVVTRPSTPTVANVAANVSAREVSADDRAEYCVYDAAGRQRYSWDAEGYLSESVYDSAGRVVAAKRYANKITRPDTPTVAGVAALVSAQLHPKDHVEYYAYDAAGHQRFKADAEGYVTEQRFDALGNLAATLRHSAQVTGTDVPRLEQFLSTIGVAGVSSALTQHSRDAAGRLVDLTDAEGFVTHYAYDGAGRVTDKTLGFGRAEASTTHYVYDANARVLEETRGWSTAEAATTRYGYDADGHVTERIDPRGVAAAAAANLTDTQKAAALESYTTHYAYDKLGRQTSATDALDGTTRKVYDAFGNVVKLTDARNCIEYFYFDRNNRNVFYVDAQGYAAASEYDAFGNKTATTQYFNAVTNSVSETLKPAVAQTAPASGSYVLADAAHDALTTATFDHLSRIKTSTDAALSTQSHDYDAFDKTGYTNQLGGSFVYEYDKRGLLTKETLPVKTAKDAARTSLIDVVNRYGYDWRGNRTWSIEAEGAPEQRSTSYAFDRLDRQVLKLGTAYKAYDVVGKTTVSVTPADVTRYDARGNVIETISNANGSGSQISGGSRTLSYYDALDRKTVQIAADGAYIAYAYAADGTVTETACATCVALPALAGTPAPAAPVADPTADRVTTTVYDALGRLTEVRRKGVIHWEERLNTSGGIELGLLGDQLSEVVTLRRVVYNATGDVVQEIDGRGYSVYHYYDRNGRKVLSVDQESYATAWDYESYQAQATTQTRYAKALSPNSYARQDDVAAAASLRDPVQLRLALDGATDRVTNYQLDALGRVTEQRTLNVAYEYVDASGARIQGSADAVTTYRYDGLGHVLSTSERVAVLGNGSTELWNTTDIVYDQLGRQTRVQAPGYRDFTGQDVRPVSDTEYDGLGNIRRQIERGTDTNDAVESDDRITRYGYNANGDRTSVTDANGYVTVYELDAARQVARSTAKAALQLQTLDANGQPQWADVVKTFQYDALGRNTVQTDVRTNQTRKTAYNAFGEISAKGTFESWQEFIEYNTLGKIQKSNTEDGVTKIFLYDSNGNTTRQISSPNKDRELRGISVIEAANDAKSEFLHTFSVYDRRNQLIKTVEPSMVYQRDELSMKQAFTQALAELYGPLGVVNATGGTYSKGQIDGSGYTYAQVTGTSSATGLPSAAPPTFSNQPAAAAFNTPQKLESSDAVTFATSKIESSNGGTYFSIPSSWPDYNYRIRSYWPSYLSWEPIISGRDEIIASFRKGASIDISKVSGDLECEVATNQWVNICSIGKSLWALDAPSVVRYCGSRSILIHAQVPPNGYVSAVIRNGQQLEGTSLYVQVAGDSAWHGVAGYYQVGTRLASGSLGLGGAAIPNGRYEIEFFVNDANHNKIAGDILTVDVDDYGCTLVETKAADNPDVLSFTENLYGSSVVYKHVIHFNTNAIGSSGGTLYMREKGTAADWQSQTVSTDGWADIHAMNLPLGKNYEFIVKTNDKESWGEFYLDTSEVATVLNGGMLRPITRNLAALSFDLSSHVAASALGASLVMEMSIGGITVSKAVSGLLASFDVASELAALGISNYANKTVAYSYRLYAQRGTLRQFAGYGSGSVRLGSDPAVVSAGTATYYQPIAVLDTAVSGTLTLWPEDTPGDVASVAMGWAGDWRRVSGREVDLSQWFTPGTARNICVQYDGADAKFSGRYRLNADGSVTCLSITSVKRQPMIPLTITGSVRLSVLAVEVAGASLESMASVTIGTRVSTSGSTFTWNADDQPRNTTRRFYYESVDAAGVTVGQGYGSFSIATDGTLTYKVDTPLLRPSLVRFNVPSNAATFTLSMKDGSTGADVNNFTLKQDGSAWVLDASALRLASGAKTYSFSYLAKASDGSIASKGTGVLTLQSNGTSSVSLQEEHKPTIVKLQGPPKKQVAKLRLHFLSPVPAGKPDTVDIDGVWDGSRSTFTWDARDYTPLDKTSQYEYVLDMLNADGSAFRNEVGDPIVVKGVMTLGGSNTVPVEMKQYVTQLDVAAQVKRYQSYNAFGEISDEYDDLVVQRAQGMVAQYGGSLDPAAVHTTFTYNTLGKLTAKADPQTHVTLENGYRYRTRPVTYYGYDLSGRVVSSTDANNNVSTQAYAGAGELVAHQWAADLGHKETGYDVFGSVRRRVDELGAVTLQDVDKLGQLTAVQRLGITRLKASSGDDAVGSTLTDTYGYDGLGQRISHTNARNWTDKTYYDSLGRVIKTVSAEGSSTTYAYTYIAADVVGGIAGPGGRSVGGYQLITTNPDGRQTRDKINYFGHTTWHQDLSGRSYNYRYDAAGRLYQQDSSTGQRIDYSYYANGYLKEAKDKAEKTLSRYGYDNAGNRVWEAYSGLAADGTSPSGIYQSSSIIYDELNRISRVKDLSVDVQYEYDAVGNRRAVHAVYWDPTTMGTRRQDDLWYIYDKANRFTITKGALVTASTGVATSVRGASMSDTSVKIGLGSEGVLIGYDAAGQRKSATAAGGAVESYDYTQDGYLERATVTANGKKTVIDRRLDALGRTLEYISGDTSTTSRYDKDNRLLESKSFKQGALEGTTSYAYYNDTTDTTSSESGKGSLAKIVFTPDPAKGGTTATTEYKYAYWDEAKQQSITITGSNASVSNWKPGTTTLTYNANGHLKMAYDDGAKITTTYALSAHGLVLQRNAVQEGKDVGKRYFYYADGRRIGDVSNDPNDQTRVSYAESLALKDKTVDRKELYKNFQPVTSSDFDQNYEPINDSYPAATGSSYTVRSGDTLQGIARALWGDAQMWYLLADANGLTGNETLVAGQVLLVPNKVTNIHNNANTFRPYNPGEAIGHIDPTLPAPPPPPRSKHGCGGLGQVIMVVVAVVVTIYTAGALSGATGSFLTTMQAGAGVLTGGAAGGAVGAAAATAAGMSSIGVAGTAALAGAAGSIASQGFAMATGMQDKFSWKQVGLSALGSGVTAGLGSVSALKGGVLMAGVRGAMGAAITQGLQGQWSWRGIAAAGVGSAAGAAAGSALQGMGLDANGFGMKLAVGMTGTMASQAVGGARVDRRSAFANVLGNALGNSIADSMQPSEQYSLTGMGGRFGRSAGDAVADWSAGVDQGITYAASRLPSAEDLNIADVGGISADELAARRLDAEEQVRLEVLGQEAREASVSGAQMFMTGGPARNAPRGGIGSSGFEMVRNGNWDAALNIGADSLGLLGELPGLQADLAKLSQIQAEKRIEGMRQVMIGAGVKNVPGGYSEALMTGADGIARNVRDYSATVNELQGVYENHVRDQRLRGTWGDDYQNLRLGKSQMSVMDFEKRVLDVHLGATDRAYAAGLDAIAKGELQIKPGEYAQELGNFIDRRVRGTLRDFARAEGINESSMSSLWAVNRRIKNEFDIGIPDNRLGFNLYADTTLARKNAYTPQIMKWNDIRPGNFMIIRPTELGGPYVIPRVSIPQPKPVGRGI